MFYLFVFLSVLLVPLVGGFASIHWITTQVSPEEFTPAHRKKCLFAEAIWLATPSVILAVSQTASLLVCIIFLFVTAIIFLLALAIHRGNDIESFAMTAVAIITLSFLLIGNSFVASVKAQRKLQSEKNAIHETQSNIDRLGALEQVHLSSRIPSRGASFQTIGK